MPALARAVRRTRPPGALAALAAAGALAACAADPPPQGTGGSPEAVARSAASQVGLTPQRVTVQRDEVEAGDGRERTLGYLVWMDVAECDEGKVIVRLNRVLYVRNITGVYGCSVPAA